MRMPTAITQATIMVTRMTARKQSDVTTAADHLSPRAGRGRIGSPDDRPRTHPGEGASPQFAETPPHPPRALDARRALPAGGESKDTQLDAAGLYRLMAWLSPAYPVGAFSYSSGLEWAVEAGDVVDAATLRDWLAAVVAEGSGFCDAVFLAHAHRATGDDDAAALRGVAELAAAFAPTKERHLETTAQGNAFVAASRAAWPCPALERLSDVWNGPVAYPVAVGVAAAGHGVALGPALHAYLHAVAANLISAGVRLIPLGQSEGQRVLAALEPVIAATAARAEMTPLEEAGSATLRADLASARHETQYTRLFRS